MAAVSEPGTRKESVHFHEGIYRYRQRGKESVAGWMQYLWDSGAEGLLLTGEEIFKLALVTT